jgi:acyl transferase domain-containing protein/surfactin synthase thioesterase subunit
MSSDADSRSVAIIGMACHFPGADTPGEFWQNLRNGVESISFFSEEQLRIAGVDQRLMTDQSYVKASPILKDFDKFDAAFFGYSPKEAMIMDPQHRLFLETCWEAFEDAGYDPEAGKDLIVGVFAGAGSALTSYLLAHCHHPAMQGQTASLQHITNDKDFIGTRVSYKLNLSGPSITVQTACSTSLVAVHLACQSLLAGECDMALAGASAVRVPHLCGYHTERGNVHSVDGHCRVFDAGATGTVFGSGVAAVLLKPLASALDDGDHIYAVIRGSAVNNDGAGKISYTAGSATGQARAVVEALEAAEVSADTVSYVECHATGTPAGDPIEIQALTRAFRIHTRRSRFCAVGSVKANIGHPEQTAGLAGLIKTALSLEHRELTPTVHFRSPNPSIQFAESPFYVQSTLCDWANPTGRRHAGVNSLGIGGTNAFIVLGEAPEPRDRSATSFPVHLFAISAKTVSTLQARARQFLAYLNSGVAARLEDICYTATVSRSRHQHRFATVCSSTNELTGKLVEFLENRDTDVTAAHRSASGLPASPASLHPPAFLFSGQGAQYAGMGRELYRAVPRFRESFEKCDALMEPHLRRSLHDILFRPEGGALLNETRFTQPALFAVEYALADLWQSWGVVPGAVMGHSVGEIVAACVAGVFDLAEAVEFMVARGELMQALSPIGVMEVFFTGEEEVSRALRSVTGDVSIAAVNSPRNTVVSGDPSAVAEVRRRLAAEGIGSRALTVSRAFHSALVEPILPALSEAATRLHSRRPRIKLISNVTGQLIECAPSVTYWQDHARMAVRFAEGIRALSEGGCRLFVEVGPGASSIMLGRECLPDVKAVWLASISRTKGELGTLLESLARLYVAGCAIEWDAVNEGLARRRVPLPTYPFERRRYWLEESNPIGNFRYLSPEAKSVFQGLAEQPVRTAPTSANAIDSQRRVHTGDEPRAGDLRTRLVNLSPETQRATIVEALREQVAIELGLQAENVERVQPLRDLGLDSLIAVNLVNRVALTLGVEISMAKLMQGASVHELADDLMAQLLPTAVPGRSKADRESNWPANRGDATQADDGRQGWLVFLQPNPTAPVRLVCFNFAGGGAATYRSWLKLLTPSTELIAIEPPGRGGRINEPPVRTLDAFVDGLLPELRRYLDRPCVFFGHCFGALTLFHVAHRLIHDGFVELAHLFVSGSRPPHRVSAHGRFEEDLLNSLLDDQGFDPLRPIYEQRDDTLARILRRFNIWATDEFLAQPTLRSLLLPAIRADFEIAARYRYLAEPPWEVPVTCFTGLDDPYVTREDASEWSRYTNSDFQLHLRKGNHFLIVEDREFIVRTINVVLESLKDGSERQSTPDWRRLGSDECRSE